MAICYYRADGALITRRDILSLLAEEIQEYLPQFEPYTADYQLVDYASRDFEEWMRCRWGMDSRDTVHERIEETLECEPEAFRVFLHFWVGCWLEKWRERVKFLPTKPKLPSTVQERLKDARRLYREMEHRSELKRMVTQRLVRQGEICMVEVIAENLIIEEVAKRIRGGMGESELTILSPLDILNSLSHRISRIREEKGPLIYLNIKPFIL